MKIALQYKSEDIRDLVSAHARSLGYDVRPEEIDVADDIVVLVEYDGVPKPPAPLSLPAAPPSAPSSAPIVELATGSSPHAPSSAEPRPMDPPKGPPKPTVKLEHLPDVAGQWSSRLVDGDPRYVPILPPMGNGPKGERMPKVKELGHETGLVKATTGTYDGRPPGWSPPVPTPADVEDNGDVAVVEDMLGATFLDDFLQPKGA